MLFLNFLLIKNPDKKALPFPENSDILEVFFLLIRSWSLINDSQQSHFAIEFAYFTF